MKPKKSAMYGIHLSFFSFFLFYLEKELVEIVLNELVPYSKVHVVRKSV